MQRLVLPGVAAICAGLALAAGACSSSSGPATAGDAGEDAPADQSVVPTDTGIASYPDTGPLPEASIHDCILGAADGGSGDPVLLCSQETALLNLLTNAYTMGTGVAPGFSSQSPYTATAGHAWQDDLGLAASLGAFRCSAVLYGDTMYLGMFDGVLADLGKLLPGEVVTAGSYDGEIYFRLRNAAQAFRQVANAGIAGALDALADGVARTIQATFVQTVTLPASDAGAATGTVIGTLDAQKGTVSYAPSQAVMAAAALLDMAARAATTGSDAGAQTATWQASGSAALAYLWTRARDPVTGLFYQALVTSGDPGHDQLDTGTYANDALLSDVQAAVVLGLVRAQAAANVLSADGGVGAASYAAQVETLVTALTSAGLFNGQTTAPQGASAQAPPGAWMEGLVPSLGLTLSNQTTASSALLLGGYARAQSLGVATAWGWEVSGLREALDFTSPLGAPWAAHSNLVSVVTDGLGDVTQVSYLAATSKSWGWAQAFSSAGTGDAGLEPDATRYSTAAVNAMIEGVTQSWYAWYAQPGQAPCAY